MFRWRLGADPLWVEIDRLQKGMDDLFTAMTGGTRAVGYPFWRQTRLFPLLNVRQQEDCFVVTAEIPGMKHEDLEIKVEEETLSLKGERKPLEPSEGASYHRRERASGTFHRSLTLPNKVDAENVKANYKDGVLTVNLPFHKAALARQIVITEE